MIFFKNKEKNQKTDKGIKRLKMFCCILFFLFLFFLILNLATTRKGLFYLSKKHITETNQIDISFLSPYVDAGFTEDESMAFIMGDDELKNFVARVMSDRYYSIFHDVKEFAYNRENGKDELSKILLNKTESIGIKIPDSVFGELVDYTMDITGVSTMLALSTPEMYINYVFDLKKQTEDTVLDLSGLSTVTSFVTVVIFFTMYVISFAILCLLCRGLKKMSYYLSDTMFTPSVFILGLSFGEVFGFETGLIVKYIFKIGIFAGVLGILGGIAIFFWTKQFEKIANTDYQ